MALLNSAKPAHGVAGPTVALLRLALMLLFCWAVPDRVQAEATREYQLKAVFLYNFAQFTEWPESAFSDKNSPLVIGILGDDPFDGALNETIHGETVRGRALVIERYRTIQDLKKCHILFISQSEASRLDRVVGRLKGEPVLTVSEVEGCAFRGVAIHLMTEKNKIHLRINVDAVSEAKLTVSSKLLRSAEIVPAEKRP